jgi:hypothetical protein
MVIISLLPMGQIIDLYGFSIIYITKKYYINAIYGNFKTVSLNAMYAIIINDAFSIKLLKIYRKIKAG